MLDDLFDSCRWSDWISAHAPIAPVFTSLSVMHSPDRRVRGGSRRATFLLLIRDVMRPQLWFPTPPRLRPAAVASAPSPAITGVA